MKCISAFIIRLSRSKFVEISIKKGVFPLLFLVLVGLPPKGCAESRTVKLPIQLDYPLMKALIIQSTFNRADQSAELINEGNGCLNLVLSEPDFSEGKEGVKLAAKVYLHAGTPMGNTCFMPFQWQGSIEFLQRPHLDPQTWQLSFETLKTTLYNSDQTPFDSVNIVWQQILPAINNYMRDITIDLAPPIADLKNFLLPLFDQDTELTARNMLTTLRPGQLVVNKEGVVANVLVDVEEAKTVTSPEPPEALTDAELEKFVELWETWDSLLVYLITTLSVHPLNAEEQQILMDLLLDTRHTFVEKINERNVERDFVREQFVIAWKQLSVIFRDHLLHNPEMSRLGYLSFFTAADALVFLDELGPTFGIEVSRDGLIRLARILSGDIFSLQYLPDVNIELQELFQISPSPGEKAPLLNESLDGSEEKEQSAGESPMTFFSKFFISEAYAGSMPSFADIKKWQAPKENHQEYLTKVRHLLQSTSVSLVARRNIQSNLGKIYSQLIPAIAWQESCFRQFVVKNKKLTYLLSYNKSSVGLMQVNERVWRGLYNRERLRWDIRYNARAGCEIANLYIQKYILRKAGPGILKDKDTLALMTYAMYNGGPGQYAKFIERDKKNTFYKSDRLFREKYFWVKSGEWENIDRCL